MAIAGSVLHKNVPLTNYVQAWVPPSVDFFMRAEVFPRLDVSKDTNIIRSIDQGQMMQIYDAEVGPEGDVIEIEFGVGPDQQYRCRPLALEGRIDHYDRSRADDALQYEYRQTNIPRQLLEMKLEKAAMDIATDPTVMTNNKALTPSQRFDNYDSDDSDPINEFASAAEGVVLDIGHKLNKVIIDKMVWRTIMFHPSVQAIAPVHTSPAGLAMITRELLEKKLEEWIEPGSIKVTLGRYNSNPEPNVKKKKSFLGANIVMAYVEAPSLNSVGMSHEFCFDGLDGNDPISVYEYQAAKGPKGSTMVRVLTSVDYKVMRPESGVLLLNVVDPTAAQYKGQL